MRTAIPRAASPRTIAIIGAGFSGAMVAAHLLKEAHGQRLRVVLLDRARTRVELPMPSASSPIH